MNRHQFEDSTEEEVKDKEERSLKESILMFDGKERKGSEERKG